MEDSTSREKILKKVRDALIEKTETPYPILDQDSSVYREITDPLDVTFAEALVKIAGKFVYCESEDEFTGTLKSFILEKDWGLLYCQGFPTNPIPTPSWKHGSGSPGANT